MRGTLRRLAGPGAAVAAALVFGTGGCALLGDDAEQVRAGLRDVEVPDDVTKRWDESFHGGEGAVLAEDGSVFIATVDDEVKVHTRSLADGDELWSQILGAESDPTVRVEGVDDEVLAVVVDDALQVLSRDDGEVLWEHSPVEAVSFSEGQIAVRQRGAGAGSVVTEFFDSTSGRSRAVYRGEEEVHIFGSNVAVVDRERVTLYDARSHDQLGRIELDGRTYHPAFGDSVLVSRGTDIAALGFNGEELWSGNVGLSNGYRLDLTERGLVVAKGRDEVEVLQVVDDGLRTLWYSDHPPAGLEVSDGRLYEIVADADGGSFNVTEIGGTDDPVEIDVDGPLAPARPEMVHVADDAILVMGTGDDAEYAAFGIDGGEERWRISLGGGSPTIADGAVVVHTYKDNSIAVTVYGG